MARPKLDIEPLKEQIKMLCEQGLPDAKIAKAIGVSPRSFTTLKRRHSWLNELIQNKDRCRYRPYRL